MAWPQMIESVLNVADQLVDVIWAGRLGARSIAGLGVAQSYVQTISSSRQGLDTAMRAMVSRAVGAGDVARANHVALQAFSLSGAFSLIVALIGVFLTEPMLHLIGLSSEVVAAGADYMRVQFIGMGAQNLRMMAGAALQASGDTFTPMRSTTLTRVLHIAMSPVFVFGWSIVPEMGLMGAAVANVLAHSAGAYLNFAALFKGTSRLHLTFRGYHPDLPLLWRLIRIGAPASVSAAERTFSQLILIGLVAPFGDTVLAAFSLTRRVETIAQMSASGLGNSAGVMVGQNLGAGKPERARKTLAWAVFYVLAINVVLVSAMLIFPHAFLSIFSGDAELLDEATKWLQIAAIGFFVQGLGMVFSQAYNTAGDTMVQMVTLLVSFWLIQQPLAVALPEVGFGALGIQYAILIGLAARLLIYVPYYFTDRWLKVKL
jgi:putative MATE family efflux protein